MPKPPISTVLKHINDDIKACADSVHRRVYHNPNGYTSAEVLAALGQHASDVLGHVAAADRLFNALGLLDVVHTSGTVVLETTGDSSSGL